MKTNLSVWQTTEKIFMIEWTEKDSSVFDTSNNGVTEMARWLGVPRENVERALNTWLQVNARSAVPLDGEPTAQP